MALRVPLVPPVQTALQVPLDLQALLDLLVRTGLTVRQAVTVVTSVFPSGRAPLMSALVTHR
jgi:hypothetical protein